MDNYLIWTIQKSSRFAARLSIAQGKKKSSLFGCYALGKVYAYCV